MTPNAVLCNFDLTLPALADPSEGVTQCLNYVLTSMGIQSVSAEHAR